MAVRGGAESSVGSFSRKREAVSDGDSDLRGRLAAEADAAAARQETATWKKRHTELRAFVSQELVSREEERR
jgi:hypothetical protein